MDFFYPDEKPGLYQPSDLQRNDENSDESDVEIAELQNEDHNEALMKLFQKAIYSKPFALPTQSAHTVPKTSINEEDDPSLENPSKGKGKERETSPIPEPQAQNQAQRPGSTDFLHLILGAVKRTYGNFPYAAIEENDSNNMWNTAEDYVDPENADFEWPMLPMPMWERGSMFASQSFRRPQPEFVTGPSRITLDDLQ